MQTDGLQVPDVARRKVQGSPGRGNSDLAPRAVRTRRGQANLQLTRGTDGRPRGGSRAGQLQAAQAGEANTERSDSAPRSGLSQGPGERQHRQQLIKQ